MSAQEGTKVSSPEHERVVRKRVRVVGEKICEVCGDKALAHHFGALSCETCKAFFRRNAARASEVKPCSDNSSCDINKNTRRNCPACRLQKCFTVGMKAELIFDEEQKRELVEKMQRNRIKQQGQKEGMDSKEQSSSSSFPSNTNLHPASTAQKMEFGGSDGACPNLYFEQKEVSAASTDGQINIPVDHQHGFEHRQSHPDGVQVIKQYLPKPQESTMCVSPDSSHCNKESIEESRQACGQVSSSPQVLNSSYSSLQIPLSSSRSSPQVPVNSSLMPSESSTTNSCGSFCNTGMVFPPARPDLAQLSRDQLPSDPQMYWHLSEEERILLTLLSAAYENTVLSSLKEHHTYPKFDMSQYTILEFLSDYEVLTRQAISFVKQLEDFKKLKLDDQIACFKGSITSIMTVRSAFVFIIERTVWITLRGEMTMETLNRLFPGHPAPEWALGIYRSLKSVLKNDITLYALLHCILVFDPSYDKVSDRQLVSTVRDKYIMLLRHYLESTFSYSYAEEYVKYFQDKLLEIADLTDFNTKLAKTSECQSQGLDNLLSYELLCEIHCDT